ncbi:MAG: bifunctional adenosylcobinamide kinase/adenosylcobinamide-phosphate guanylyltransferase [Paracoccaceae bacterium]
MAAELDNLTLVLGGARSGKSRLAERVVRATGGRKVYIATAEAWDAEMTDRIARHRTDRGAGWHTLETPRDLCGALAGLSKDDAVLIDCATLWLSNLMHAGEDPAVATADLLGCIACCPASVIIVSNEVGQGIVPENALARTFRDEQGRLNQRLAEAAGRVIVVFAGLPMALKGALPALAP